MRPWITAPLIVLYSLPSIAMSNEVETRIGGDSFVAGQSVLRDLDTPGDAFEAAETVTLSGASLGDLHVSGFDVSVRTDVAEDLYAMGAALDIRSRVAGDISAMGFTVRTAPEAETGGNLRLAGNTVTIEGPVAGALVAMGRTVILDARIAGDVSIMAGSLAFGDNAEVAGTLTYSSRSEVTVPESVAAAERVTFNELDFDADWDDVRDAWPGPEMPMMPTAMSLFGALIISVLFFVVLGALALAFIPARLERMRASIAAAPGRTMLLGVIGLSLLFGMVPITALTIVGIPFVPFILLAIVVVWTLGYALGAYSIAVWVWRALGNPENPTTLARLLLLAGAVIVIAVLNFIPFVGWVANFTLVLIGIGAITRAVFASFITDPDAALDVDMQRPTTD